MAEDESKKASWVELYFDLVFVMAVAQVAHAVSDQPDWSGAVAGLGIFTALWWTWIGFVLFYNRYGEAASTWQRLAIVAGTLPCGLAAVAVHDMAHGNRAAFTWSMVAARVLLALMYAIRGGELAPRLSIGYAAAATGLALSLFATTWWPIWLVILIAESANVFMSDRRGERPARRRRGERPDMSVFKPGNPAYALDSHHLSERFGLFIIILLGEVVASAGLGALAADRPDWVTLTGAIAVAGALWWIYFDAVADLNQRVLELAGGSPALAKSIFAFGHMIPAFALILTAAGLHLLLAGHAPAAAFWLVSIGIGIYLFGTRAVMSAKFLGLILIVATFQLGRLHEYLSAAHYVWIVTGWTLLCAYVASLGVRRISTRADFPGD